MKDGKQSNEVDFLLQYTLQEGVYPNYLRGGAGTNHYMPHFSHTRLGLSMSLALMTILLYQYNSKEVMFGTGHSIRISIWHN